MLDKFLFFGKINRWYIFMRVKVVLVCEECLSRNYMTEKNKLNTTERVIVKKFCKRCNKHTVHKETK